MISEFIRSARYTVRAVSVSIRCLTYLLEGSFPQFLDLLRLRKYEWWSDLLVYKISAIELSVSFESLQIILSINVQLPLSLVRVGNVIFGKRLYASIRSKNGVKFSLFTTFICNRFMLKSPENKKSPLLLVREESIRSNSVTNLFIFVWLLLSWGGLYIFPSTISFWFSRSLIWITSLPRQWSRCSYWFWRHESPHWRKLIDLHEGSNVYLAGNIWNDLFVAMMNPHCLITSILEYRLRGTKYLHVSQLQSGPKGSRT